MNVLDRISEIGIVPVVAISDVEKAVPLARALADGGIPCAEVTFRTAQGEEAIRRMAAEVPEVLLGAGTVLTTEQVDRAVDAGAKFIVSPGLNPKVVDYCIKKNIPITPGCANPSDLEVAIEHGLEVVKFFPAEQAGGLAYIKAVSAPYSSLRFMPTGGISPDNLNSYLAFDKIIACGGSWMVKSDLIEDGKFDVITDLCKQAVLRMHGFKLKHIGINTANESEALAAAKIFELLFGFKIKNGNSSVFADIYIEVMKHQGYGKNGHIAIGVNNVRRAKAYIEHLGYEFIADTAPPYLKDEVAGFMVHIVAN